MKTVEYYIGRTVVLKGNHPWAGEKGVIKGKQEAKGIGKIGLIVELDNGTECFVFDMNQMRIV